MLSLIFANSEKFLKLVEYQDWNFFYILNINKLTSMKKFPQCFFTRYSITILFHYKH